jgi:hypothetical protein
VRVCKYLVRGFTVIILGCTVEEGYGYKVQESGVEEVTVLPQRDEI